MYILPNYGVILGIWLLNCVGATFVLKKSNCIDKIIKSKTISFLTMEAIWPLVHWSTLPPFPFGSLTPGNLGGTLWGFAAGWSWYLVRTKFPKVISGSHRWYQAKSTTLESFTHVGFLLLSKIGFTCTVRRIGLKRKLIEYFLSNPSGSCNTETIGRSHLFDFGGFTVKFYRQMPMPQNSHKGKPEIYMVIYTWSNLSFLKFLKYQGYTKGVFLTLRQKLMLKGGENSLHVNL